MISRKTQFPLIIRLQKPNLLSIIWGLICLNLFLFEEDILKDAAFYCIIGLSCASSVLNILSGSCKYSKERRLILLFSFLIFIQSVGLLQNLTLFSIRNILATVGIFCFIDFIAFQIRDIQISYFRIPFYLVLLFIASKSNTGLSAVNTTPACMVFLTLSYLIAEHYNDFGCREFLEKEKSLVFVRDSILVVVIAYICIQSRSRTPLLALLFILCSFIFYFRKSKLNFNKLLCIFWIFIISALLLIVLYIYITNFSWYDDLNNYSILYFGKNIDSSRGLIWKTSYDSLEFWQVLTGAGTGKLPDLEAYIDSSFHNSFLQLLMQNGIIGLSCFISILWVMWKIIAETHDEMIQRFVLSVFLGIILYNCFETTLLQNKAFLGIIQWFIISLGIRRSTWIKSR